MINKKAFAIPIMFFIQLIVIVILALASMYIGGLINGWLPFISKSVAGWTFFGLAFIGTKFLGL